MHKKEQLMPNHMATSRHEPAFDIDKIRADFPIFSRQVNGKPLVYLDSAASAWWLDSLNYSLVKDLIQIIVL